MANVNNNKTIKPAKQHTNHNGQTSGIEELKDTTKTK